MDTWPNNPDGWRERLHARLVGQPHPLLIYSDRILPAASLWWTLRAWVQAFRSLGVGAGDRIVLSSDAVPAFIPVLLAGLWERLSVAVVAPGAVETMDLLAQFDARALVCASPSASPFAMAFDDAGLPVGPTTLRPAIGAPTPDARLLLKTSGTRSGGRWIALSDENLLAVLDSHAMAAPLPGACVLSVLPWHHAFGLVLDLLAGLLAGAEIVRDERAGRDPDALMSCARTHPISHLSAVPLTLERLCQVEGGRTLLRNLTGGLVGGAPVSAGLASALAGSRLRVGYGQTEAGPGICLGAPGEFWPGWIGRPLGCAVRIEDDDVLAFTGPNAALGEWNADGLTVLDPSRWVRTEDLVRPLGDGFVFEGRAADAFKMANGRFLSGAKIEASLIEAIPSLQACMVGTRDGHAFEVAVTADAQAGLDHEAIGSILQRFGTGRFHVHRVGADQWYRSPKGELDRRRAPWLTADPVSLPGVTA